MEWNQIANSWAAMTNRLRSDRIATLRYGGASQDVRRSLRTADADPSDSLPPEPPVTDNGLRPSQ
ncbi:MAG: hypothetical protein Q8S27_13805 [Hoeflea sp.]|uniref:hypothetical protein n=1 Tax=Hoeflea sp. TaxID=1940281 RepID=UPI00272F3F24|nr:hypothetical protein [Hoeflea sp.]MDP2121663.1 hypothetical protein [Hoeflea sp.]MDP3525649.1 hypothetical protein [Hoeflea sp.]MDZ7602432.1 hypothetical protein [Hoeflea sp.]